MNSMVNLLVLYPEHLNLNGDVANAGVLARRMNWYGLSAAIEFYSLGDELPNYVPDFVLLGHGSTAAWNEIRSDLRAIWPTLAQWFDAGVAGLAVNSGQELLHGSDFGLFSGELTAGERSSKFVVADASEIAEGMRLLGYQNSVFDAPFIERYKNLVGTQLHSPVLAKNGWFADWFISQISGVAPLEATQIAKADLERVAAFEAGVWQLEEPLAN